MEIVTSNGSVVLIDDEDARLLPKQTIYVGKNGYAYYSVWSNGRSLPHLLHHRIMGKHPGKHVDHINGDRLDNRRANLRVVTAQKNQINRRGANSNNTSGVRGVTARGNRWIAQIMVARRTVYLGIFKTLEEAVTARRAAELEHYGELCPTC